MEKSINKMIDGYHRFREKYALGDKTVMQHLSHFGQHPHTMVVACCDSRVDPALILQCAPGDLFVVRNVANIVPPYENDEAHHGTSAALEFGVRQLKVKHLILLGHSQCGGIQALLRGSKEKNDFITNWVSLVEVPDSPPQSGDEYAKLALKHSQQNCLTFPWIKEKIDSNELRIHLWFFDIEMGQIFRYSETKKKYEALDLD
jgi:carbonic anhydrase